MIGHNVGWSGQLRCRVLHLYTDASLFPHCNVGGYAVTTEDEILFYGVAATTVTRLEGIAVLQALYLTHTIFTHGPVTVYTDAEVWYKRYTQLPYLVEHHWHKSNGNLVKEVDILSVMWKMYDTPRVQVEWVRGHSGVVGNTLAHHAARTVIYGRVTTS